MEEVGWWMSWRYDDCKPFWSRVEIPTRMQIFFSLIFVYNCFANCIVRIRSLVFVPIHTFFLYELYSTNSYNEPRGRSPSTPPAPTRPHPAAPTLGYTRLPRPVRVRSWGGWVRNGITIRKSGLYDFIRMAYSQPLNTHVPFLLLVCHTCLLYC